MKEWTRWLTVGSYQLNCWGTFLNQSLMILIILPAFILFCLTQQGCDNQEDVSGGMVESQNQNSPIASIPKSRTSPLRQEEAKGTPLPRIVAFGDSLTAGLGVDQNDAYPGQLARWLREQGYAYDVINAGVSGDTSAGGLRRVEWILKSQPKLVIVELGANDGLRGQPLKETYETSTPLLRVSKRRRLLLC